MKQLTMVESVNIYEDALQFSEEQLQQAAIQIGKEVQQSVAFSFFLMLRPDLTNSPGTDGQLR